MTDSPWLGDACSLVDAFRAGERSPMEELDATLGAIERSGLNAFSFLDADAARATARRADAALPFGGVPIGVKELDAVRGWPATEASVPLKDRVSPHDSTMVARLRTAGAVPFGLTTSSEFGGVNLTRTNLNGVTRNPWDLERTPGGSSGGAAASVAGGLITIATGGDGGGSIRIPCGFTGLLGLKNTYGRIPKGPQMCVGSLTAVTGCLARSARDVARFLDATNGFDLRDPYSLPRVEGWEVGLDTHDLRGKKAVIVADLGVAVLHPELTDAVHQHGEMLARDAGLELVEVPVKMPELSLEWAFSGLAEVRKDLGDLYPACEEELTFEISLGLKIAEEAYNLQFARQHRGSQDPDEREDGGDLRGGRFRDRLDESRSRLRRGGAAAVEVQRRRGGLRQQRGAHDPGEHLREPRDLDPHRHEPRAPHRPAGARTPPPRGVAPRPGADRRARAALAARRARFPRVTLSPACVGS